MYKLRLEIPWTPTSLNKKLNAHFHDRSKENRAWDIYLATECRSRRPAAPLARARLTLVRHGHRMLDFDGLVGSMKPVVDALVFAAVLADDSWAVLGRWNVDQRYRPRKDGPSLTIEVEEIPS